ncbi:hypothetical protein KGM_214658 [Danaus plexippus plexippus]|uniref:Ribosome-binding factor A, mitochondrial n=1 Tax=Danaus plexippus plexippus TaxID=278856 RepID=A0A212FLR8_DANPL|nr:hypothetical protein KGM_214658 [Danaus plexippus plexippus]
MLRRFYHSTCVLNNLKKQGLKLSKMLNPKSKKRWYPNESLEVNMPSVKSLTKVKNEPGKRGVRRIAMLNKLFMKNITDILSTGTVSLKVVKIMPNLQSINVFWVCKGDASDVQTEALLHSIAGPLRHELSTLRLMGEVPYIFFVKDRQESQTVDLDRRLAVADYGDDYTPTEIGHLLRTDFTLNTKLSPEVKAKIKQLEEKIYDSEDPIPEMTHNVYGLDHAKILNRLLGARRKTRDAWDSIKAEAPSITYRAEPKTSNIDIGRQKKDISEFLLQRQIQQNKLYKKMRSDQKNVEIATTEEEQVYFEEDYYEDEEDIYEFAEDDRRN